MIERLFQALKVETKQFNEFENWIEQGKLSRHRKCGYFVDETLTFFPSNH